MISIHVHEDGSHWYIHAKAKAKHINASTTPSTTSLPPFTLTTMHLNFIKSMTSHFTTGAMIKRKASTPKPRSPLLTPPRAIKHRTAVVTSQRKNSNHRNQHTCVKQRQKGSAHIFRTAAVMIQTARRKFLFLPMIGSNKHNVPAYFT